MQRKPGPTSTGVDLEHPLVTFAADHTLFTGQLEALSWLPQLARSAARARRVAEESLALFATEVERHHREEEKQLFTAVLRSARPGAEMAQMRAWVERLTAEHASIEAQWQQLRPQLRKLAAGKDAELDAEALEALIEAYFAHARWEEEVFLPRADEILRRDGNHMAALALSLHMSRVPLPVPRI
ncbi:hemerythrin domain-containing protein [Ramlibacter sp. AN1015]|uniref:hemerythrin domain-containing protein n=1 Tax=Ramlibacter sp. AN1015 TaxID=3133428 RepID=UPI0030C482F2